MYQLEMGDPLFVTWNSRLIGYDVKKFLNKQFYKKTPVIQFIHT